MLPILQRLTVVVRAHYLLQLPTNAKPHGAGGDTRAKALRFLAKFAVGHR